MRCRICGAPKIKPPKTAFVYCDYCGAFTDWDFHIANSTAGSERPDPKYDALFLYLKPRLEEARLRGDRAAYAGVQRQLFDAHVASCRAAYSPRVGDAAYRRAIIEYGVAAKVVGDFDSSLERLAEEAAKAERTMRWVDEAQQTRARPDRFWNLFGAWRAHKSGALGIFERVGVLRLHPDGAPLELLLRIETSAFVQRWLPRLGEADARRLLAETGLGGDYDELAPVALVDRHCGACGDVLACASGARRVLCEACGYLIEVEAAEIACAHCGAALSVPDGARTLGCPYCKAHVQLLR